MPCGQKKILLCWFFSSHFRCPVVTLVTFSSNLNNFKKNPKFTKKLKIENNKKNLEKERKKSKISKNSKLFQKNKKNKNISESHRCVLSEVF